ncbi:ImmA/IrrE family metallo-endopeptidase [Methylobacterium brachythecii]|uniref:Zn-dependent peptidase ImmA (M78 family) n=1 Tax=Methylobacterium brachythecii TaxID=1176177 RepID=A0A7W6AKE9_9HYPH|nr:ImmA/IrrE family metallo-endopeptidase [Methylobacterium brachythecii]MBB3902804.1 Zn-dependent peptidase ImmA (M78 family) [Methylobacterium brachythecii]GLS43729.1 hypothetical protein GCM10007884_17140 [Methylobacterium brachythecii]
MALTWHEHLGRNVPDYRLVKAKVDDALRQNYVSNPPVPVRDMAINYGVDVFFGDFGDAGKTVSGFLDLQDNCIFVNKDESPARQNFTIAHELGHFLLHADLLRNHPNQYSVLYRAPIGAAKDPLEQEANAFAAHILVPRSFLDRYYKIASRQELARLFNVSEDVIGYRMAYEYKSAA